ncbi:MAG: GNAT family N-acetyltransferase [Myxococcota bacterium]
MSAPRRLTSSDLEAVAAWDETLPARGALLSPGPQEEAFVLCDGGGPVVLLRGHQVAEEAELHLLWTRPSARRRGWGGRLLSWWLARLAKRGVKRVLLEVRADNSVAAPLYAKLGFAEVGRRSGYFDGVDARILAREEGACEDESDGS